MTLRPNLSDSSSLHAFFHPLFAKSSPCFIVALVKASVYVAGTAPGMLATL